MICWHDAEHNRPAECGDHAGVVPAGLKRWCLNGQAEGGCVMTRLYAWLWQGCASLALVVLLVGLAAWGTSGVWAEEEFPAEPCPCLPDETPQECALRCGQENRRCNTFGCTTSACYRTGYRRCNTTGNECRQMTNPPLCGGCTCREHEPDPCICEL
jgi:hypothetical protein